MRPHRNHYRFVVFSIPTICLLLFLLPQKSLTSQACEDIPKLISALENQDEPTRRDAIQILSNCGPSVVPYVLGCFEHRSWYVRSAAVEIIGSIGTEATRVSPRTVNAVSGLLRDDDSYVRKTAIATLVKLRPEPSEVLGGMIERLSDVDTEVACKAADAIVQFNGGGSAVSALMATMRGSELEIRVCAIRVLGRLGLEASASIQSLINALPDPVTHQEAAISLTMIADDAKKLGAVSSISDLREISNALTAANENDRAQAVIDTVRHLESLSSMGFFQTLSRLEDDHPALLRVVVVLLFYPTGLLVLWTALLFLKPIWLLRLGERLRFGVRIKQPFEFDLQLRHIAFLNWFQYSPRVLDAWVDKSIRIAGRRFRNIRVVKERGLCVSLPVLLDGRRIIDLYAKDLAPTFEKNSACLLITGEGGAGKTTLALRIAKWAMEEKPTDRLCKDHVMLPVLVEPELELAVNGSPSGLLETITGQLRNLVDEADVLSQDFVDQLLRKQRVLIVIDGFSEFSEGTRQQIRFNSADFPVNALIITSRIDEALDNKDRTAIVPSRIAKDRLVLFLPTYLRQKGKEQLLTDVQFLRFRTQLLELVGEREITVLLAKLYTDHFIRLLEDPVASDIPTNVPDLMLSYLNDCNRQANENDPDDRTVQRVAKIIAWECLRGAYRPIRAQRHRVMEALSTERNAEVILKYLEDKLRLIRTIGAAHDRIQFELDPLAEYLAGLHLLELLGKSRQSWSDLLTHARRKSDKESIRGFLLAVRDCCLARGSDLGVPDFVASEIGKQYGHDPEVEGLMLETGEVA